MLKKVRGSILQFPLVFLTFPRSPPTSNIGAWTPRAMLCLVIEDLFALSSALLCSHIAEVQLCCAAGIEKMANWHRGNRSQDRQEGRGHRERLNMESSSGHAKALRAASAAEAPISAFGCAVNLQPGVTQSQMMPSRECQCHFGGASPVLCTRLCQSDEHHSYAQLMRCISCVAHAWMCWGCVAHAWMSLTSSNPLRPTSDPPTPFWLRQQCSLPRAPLNYIAATAVFSASRPTTLR